MKAKQQIEKVAGEIADEVVELATNSAKMAGALEEFRENKELLSQVAEENKRLKERIIRLEKRLGKQTDNLKIDVVEIDRLISEKWEQFEDERNQDIMNLINQIQSLRDSINKKRV